MDNVTEVVALLRQQAALGQQLMNTGVPAVAAEWALATVSTAFVGGMSGCRARPAARRSPH
jgi:hypothetical protein